jgi:dipeptidyl aminopeptidase/acylaminoacyl peptidase
MAGSRASIKLRRAALMLVAGAALVAGVVAGSRGDRDDAPALPGAERSAPRPPEPAFTRVPGVVSTAQAGLFDEAGVEGWESTVPRIQEVRITSSRDRSAQPALWLPPAGGGPRPLLVVLHSWSTGYENIAGVPYAQWAQERGWATIQPDYRGPFDDPDATGSDLAVQDVMDAVDFASRDPGVDPERVFVVGFSGGGMMSLLLAGRHPDRFAGLVSWVPIDDLSDWYVYSRSADPRYAEEIAASCGGDPTAVAAALAQCERRSPRRYLAAARRAEVPIYIGHGLADDVVPPDHALRAFNRLADSDDAVPASVVRASAGHELPPGARGSVRAPTYFRAPDPRVVFARRSGNVTVVLFEGEHDMIYHPGLEWMARLARRP